MQRNIMGNDLNTFSQSSNAEVEAHGSSSCYYAIVRTKNGILLIRVCRCGGYIDKSYLRNKTQIDMADIGDGVELHLNSSCRYQKSRNQNGVYMFRLVCYCPT